MESSTLGAVLATITMKAPAKSVAHDSMAAIVIVGKKTGL